MLVLSEWRRSCSVELHGGEQTAADKGYFEWHEVGSEIWLSPGAAAALHHWLYVGSDPPAMDVASAIDPGNFIRARVDVKSSSPLAARA